MTDKVMHLDESKSHLVLFSAGAIVLHFLFYRYKSDIVKNKWDR